MEIGTAALPPESSSPAWSSPLVWRRQRSRYVFKALLFRVDAEENLDQAGRSHEDATDQIANSHVEGSFVAISAPNSTGPIIPPIPVPTA